MIRKNTLPRGSQSFTVLGLLLSLLSSPAHAQSPRLGSTFTVNPSQSNTALTSIDVATNARGDTVVAWGSHENKIFARPFINGGAAASGYEFRVDTPLVSTLDLIPSSLLSKRQRLPKVAINASGDYVVVYTATDALSSAGVVKARLYQFPRKASLPVEVTLPVMGGEQYDVAIDNNGNFVVVWAGDGVQAQRFSVIGVPLGLPVKLAPGAPLDLAITMRGNGLFTVAWSQYEGVYVRNFKADGNPSSAIVKVDLAPLPPTHLGANIALASDANGNAVVGWMYDTYKLISAVPAVTVQCPSDYRCTVKARRFNAALAPKDAAEIVVGNGLPTGKSDYDIGAPALAVALDASGRFSLTWEMSGGVIQMRRYDAAAQPVDATPFAVGQPKPLRDAQFSPALALDAAGNLLAVWAGQSAGGGFYYGGYAQRVARP